MIAIIENYQQGRQRRARALRPYMGVEEIPLANGMIPPIQAQIREPDG